jgi:GTP-binding protein
VFDLFAALDATEEQLDFPHLYASSREGWAANELDQPRTDLTPLFDRILAHVPPPQADPDAPFRMLVSIIEADNYLGRILTGRILNGTIRPNAPIKALARDGAVLELGRVMKLLAFRGLERQGVELAEAGDIVAIAGLTKATVADTLCDPVVTEAVPAPPIDPPTLAMSFSINDSPLAGTEGDKVTSRQLRARLYREMEGNVAIRVNDAATGDAQEVAGRGELQLGVLIETMRREGFELSVGRPRVLYRDEGGQRQEPIEEVAVDVDEGFAGVVVEEMGRRRGELMDMKPSGGGKLRLRFLAPTRGLIGYHGQFLTDTRGTGIMYRLFHGYAPFKGPIPGRRNGVLVSNGDGTAVPYALWYLEERGAMFIDPGVKVYEGMIIGENARDNDLDVNPLRTKQLTNIRAAMKDDAVRLTPPRKLTLEQAIAYIADDELVEVTPKNIRLRKRFLDPNDRKRALKAEAAG